MNRLRILLSDKCIAAASLRRRRGRWELLTYREETIDVPTHLHDGIDWDEVSTAIHAVVSGCTSAPGPADLIVPTTWCYTARLIGLDRRSTSETAAYALEEFLPLPIEEVTTAFARPASSGASGNACWGMAVRTAPLRALLAQLDIRNIAIDRVLVDAMVMNAAYPPADDLPSGIVWKDARRLILIQRGTDETLPVALRALHRPRTTTDTAGADTDGPAADGAPIAFDSALDPWVRRQIALTEAYTGLVAADWVLVDLMCERRQAAGSPDPAVAEGPAPALHRLLTAEINDRQPDLRAGALTRGDALGALTRSAKRCAALVALLLIILLADTVRTRRDLERANSELLARQTALFKETLPDAVLRAGPALQLASERKRIAALTPRATGDANGDALRLNRAGPLNDLRAFIDRLPGDVRITLLEANIDAQQASLRGITADHRDAERIADAVRAIAGASVPPPRTSRDKNGGVEFTIRARKVAHAAQP